MTEEQTPVEERIAEDLQTELSEHVEEEPAGTPTETPEEKPEPAAEFIEFDGRQIPIEDFRTKTRFMDWASQNPTAWDELVAWEQGKKVLVDANAQKVFIDDDEEEEEFEFSDPGYERLQKELKEIRSKLEDVGQVTGWREELSRREAMQAGIQSFNESHPDLAEEDWNRLFLSARDHELIRVYVKRDPYNPVEAVKRALEAAYRLEFWDRAHQNGQKQVADDIAARRRAAAASSSKASVPRQSDLSQPGTRDAMLADIRELMSAAE